MKTKTKLSCFETFAGRIQISSLPDIIRLLNLSYVANADIFFFPYAFGYTSYIGGEPHSLSYHSDEKYYIIRELKDLPGMRNPAMMVITVSTPSDSSYKS